MAYNNAVFEAEIIGVADLELDPQNPRIRLRRNADQKQCVDRLADPNGEHLVALCRDIAANNIGLDAIVVEKIGDRRVVRDGNRRTACIQMLLNPQMAPGMIRARIQKIADEGGYAPEKLECQVTEDRDAILTHIHRKHTGEGKGEGLRAWKTVEQARWEIDHGFESDDTHPAYIVRYAEDMELIGIPPDLPITTLTRFLKRERILAIGFDDLKERPPVLNQPEDVVHARVRKMIEDLDSEYINVSRTPKDGQVSFMTQDGQETYLEELLAMPAGSSSDGSDHASGGEVSSGGDDATGTGSESAAAGSDVSGSGTQGAASQDTGGTNGAAGGGGSRSQQEPWKRTYVAYPVRHNGIQRLPNDARKGRALMIELKRINVEKCPNACAATVRMFIEVSVDSYIARKRIRNQKRELKERLKKAVDNMVHEKVIDSKEGDFYKQQTSRDQISVVTLHGIVHSGYFVGDRQTINSFWDTLLPFLRHCWHS